MSEVGLALEGLTIKEECPMDQEIKENPEVPAGVENSVYTAIVKQKMETLSVKNEINHVEESKIKVENGLHPVVRIERNFELEQALKGKIKSEPQGENVKRFGSPCDEFNNVSDCTSFQNLMQTVQGDNSLISGLSMVVCISCNQCFTEKNDLRNHVCVGTEDKCYSGRKRALRTVEPAYNNDSKISKHVGSICYARDKSKQKNSDQKRTYICEICGSQFKNKKLLSRHCKNHLFTSNESFTCLQCGKSFKNKVLLNSHLISHSKKKNFSCGHCDKLFKGKLGLQRHIQHFHCEEQKKYECGECSKSFVYKNYLKHHKLKMHSDSRPLACSECGDKFKDRFSLKIHIQTHTGTKPFSCSFCDKKFAQIPHVRRHERLHTGVKPYLCKICGKSFRDSSNLKVHQIFHSGLRPFKCDKCGKGFTQQSHLNTHIKTHNEERPYVCNICGDSFKQRLILKSHVLLHSDVKPYNCEDCGRSFVQYTAYKRHKCY